MYFKQVIESLQDWEWIGFDDFQHDYIVSQGLTLPQPVLTFDWHYPNQCWLLTDITPTSVDFALVRVGGIYWTSNLCNEFGNHPFIKITSRSPSGLRVASLSPEGSGLDFQYKFTTVISFRSVFVDMFHCNRNPCYQLQTHQYYRYDVRSHEHSIPWRRALWGNNFSS